MLLGHIFRYWYQKIQCNRTKVVACRNRPLFVRPAALQEIYSALHLALAEPNGAVAGMHGQGLASTVHFPVDFGVLEGALNGQRDAKADVPVIRAGVNVRLQVWRQNDVHAAIPRAD